jgi:hypothetical protein
MNVGYTYSEAPLGSWFTLITLSLPWHSPAVKFI